MNQYIRTTPIRVIDEEGKNLGVLETSEALRIATTRNLDLIEISATAKPPVCKIMDFGKFKYEKEKGEREHGKKQKEVELKGVRIGFTTGKHDLEMRARQIEKFLGDGDKVRIQMKLTGREKAHGPLALQKFNEFLKMITTEYQLELPPKRLPQGFLAIITKK
ncbi:MAG: translation initiation factor IF-3 [bacterium]|nr:translation initiation factor IF-3 [bacterium]MDZ4286249.1 translation initiation factor IF-3 [Candidatus Sungbacteria bacterium]